jgi:hypothetical protein
LAERGELLAMTAAVADACRGRGGETVPVPGTEALLVEQLARATRELRVREAQGCRTDVARAVVLSLRKTLSWMAEHGCVPNPDAFEFVVRVSPEGESELRHRGQTIPILPERLREDFAAAGVALEAGQVLLAERDLARRIVEESIVAYSLEEFRLRVAKAALLRTLSDVRAPITAPGTGRA